jgi:hypothetical protein
MRHEFVTTDTALNLLERLDKQAMWEIHMRLPIELYSDFESILAERDCWGHQIRGIWDTIRHFEWYFPRNEPLFFNRNLTTLYDILQRFNPPDPALRKHESAKTWVTRYFHLASHNKWRVVQVNIQALDFPFSGWPCRINYHLEVIESGHRILIYCKHGKDWTRPQIITTLSMIRFYDELVPLFNGTVVIPTAYRFYCMSEDSEHQLSDREYRDWIFDMTYKLKLISSLVTNRIPVLHLV